MMASLPTGSDNLLEISTEKVTVIIKTKGKRTAIAVDTAGEFSSLYVYALNARKISVPVQHISEDYADCNGLSQHEINIAPLFFEQTDYVLTVRSLNKEQLEFHSNSSLIEERVGRVFDDDGTLLSGVINFGNNVGFTDFTIIADGIKALSVRMEVYPGKISYKDDYRKMMADINNIVSESVLDFMRKTYQLMVPNHTRNEVPAVFFAVLETVYGKFVQALNRILAIPHHKQISVREIVPFYKAKRTDTQSEKWLKKHPECMQRQNGKILSEKTLSVKKQITYDTQENRLVKFMLRSTIRKIADFSARYSNGTLNPEQNVLSKAGAMERELKRLLGSPFFTGVSEYSATQSMSLVFGMAPGYRELYKYYLILQNGITVGGEIFRMSVRETAQLYEYWCFVKLYTILKDKYVLCSPDIIKVNRRGVTVDLVKGQQSRITFLNTQTGECLYLAYNPSEERTQTVNQKPDNVLELQKNGSKTNYKYIFDAKYRIETNPGDMFYPGETPGPKVDDINTMHRYRDSIVYANENSRFQFEKTMFGAYILFPYTNEDEYKNHHFYKSIETVNIGGLPFLPSATSLVTNLLDTLITDSSESAFERATLPIGIEDRIGTVDWNKRDVLIGLVNDASHLKLFLENNLYFTRKFDTSNLPIRYVALYEKGSGIRYYGETVAWRKASRNSLPGSSEFGSMEYHVFDVLEWRKLPALIKTEETGPNPTAYTNRFLLDNAESYSELRLRNEADYRLFIELKRRTGAKVSAENGDTIALESGNARLLIDNNKIHVIKNGKLSGTVAIPEFNKKPNAQFRILQSYM